MLKFAAKTVNMKQKLTHLLLLVAAVCLSTMAHAQLSLGTLNTNHVIDFSTTVSGVNNGAFSRASGNAIFANPASAGQLNQAGLSLVGDGATAQAAATFPGATLNASFAHFTAPYSSMTTTSTGYGSAALDGDNMLAIFPSGSAATPGSLTLRMTNSTGSTVNRLVISYKVYCLNNGPRANRIGFFHSANNTANSYTEVTNVNYVSTESSTPVTRDSVTRFLTIDIPGGVANGNDYFLRWFFEDVSGGGNRDKFFLDNISVQPQFVSLPNVSISLSSNSGSEAAASATTITATADAAVSGNQTINLIVTGSGVTTGDYTLSNATITILDGQTSGTVTLTVNDDQLNEPTENLTITLSGPSSGIGIGAPNSASYSITDNDADLVIATLGSYTAVQTMDQLSPTATGTSAADIPAGFYFKESGTNANGFYAAGDGSLASGNTYAFGTGTNTDRAFGGIGAGGLVAAHFGFRLQNTSGAIANKLALQYTGEQWRDGTSASDRLDVQISLNATSIDDSSATWIDLNNADFIPPGTLNTGVAVDGNQPANRVSIVDTSGGFGNIPNNATFWVRWVDTDSPGNDDGVAIDDVSFALIFETPSIFYSKPTGSLSDLNTWNSEPDFSGSAPTSFSSPNSTFNLVNRTSVTLDDTLQINGSNSILVIGDGATATELFTTATLPLLVNSGATVRIATNSTFHGVHFIMPAFNSIQGANSTISFEQTVGATTIPSGNYVNLSLKNATKNFGTGTFNISGNLLLENTSSIAPGSPFASIVLGGDFTQVNSSAFVGPESITLTTTGNGLQNFNAGNGTITLFRLISTKTSGGINVVKNSNSNTELICRDDFRLNMSGTATFTDNGSTLQCGGDFNCDGTTSNYSLTGNLVMNGTVSQNIRRSEASSTLIQAELNNVTFIGGTAAGLFFQPTGSTSNMTIKGNLTITPSLPYTGSLNLGTNKTLFLNGNLTIAGVTLTGTGSTIEMSGSAAQTITSTDINNVANSRLTSLRINNSNGVTFTSTDTLEVANSLTVVSGTLNTNDRILIRSTGNLLHGAGTPTAGGSVNGQIMITRNSNNSSLTASNLWTSPVATGFLSNIGGLDHNMFDANLQVWQIQGMGNPTTNAMPVGRGYSIYGGGDATFRGVANNGNYSFPIVNNTNKTDWNLVGNPYPSSILLDELINVTNNPDITGTVYLWDRTISDYRPLNNLNAGTLIAAGQGFFVEATTNSNISFTNAMRSASTSNFLRTQNTMNLFALSISGTNLYNRADIAFGNAGTTAFDHGYDARKLRSNSGLALYTFDNSNNNLCVQALPEITAPVVVPVGLEAPAGTYDITIEECDIDPTINVYLEDNGTLFNLRNGSYNFTLAQASNLTNRFKLHFQPMITTSVPTINEENMVIGMNGRQLLVKAADETTTIASIQVTDLTGRVVRQMLNLNASGTFNQEIDVQTGIYLVTVKTANGKVQTAKVMAR